MQKNGQSFEQIHITKDGGEDVDFSPELAFLLIQIEPEMHCYGNNLIIIMLASSS